MIDYLWIWSEMLIRWVHVIAGIAWIGSSFYFIALDLSLKPGKQLPDEAHGQAWQVHGGGFYNMVKYLVAPKRMPDELTWFKWEAYGTWISGIALMALVYYGAASLYMIDFEILDITEWQAVAISLAGIVLGWAVYDGLCRSPLGRNDTMLALAGFAFLVALAYGYTQIFSARGAFMQMGVTIGTMMVANVLMVIIPGQTKVVAALKAGDTPDSVYGIRGKQRSLHNNYLTLPIIFLMLSNHYPLAFATEHSWIIASLVFLMGVTIRHYFNSRHANNGNPRWTWAATAVIFGIIMALSVAPLFSQHAASDDDEQDTATLLLTPEQQKQASHPLFEEVSYIIEGRCSMCHAAEPLWEGIVTAPKNVYLETHTDILDQAGAIFMHSAISHAMPPANITYMETAERALIRRWYQDINR